LRLYTDKQKQNWLDELKRNSGLINNGNNFPIKASLINLLEDYILESKNLLDEALNNLRTEAESLAYCKKMKFPVGATATKNKDHHQSSKSLISAVSTTAKNLCESAGCEVNLDPQRRAIWFTKNQLHVSARNLDGAIPSLENPLAIWEIKEYWGTTKGGSKMSDAVYECQLVGLELRHFEKKSDLKIKHIVFVDGKEQWGYRKSDLLRFIDLHQQGLIDHLIVGRQVETDWKSILQTIILELHASECRSSG